MESFRSQKNCKLIKLPSTVSGSASQFSSSVIAVAPGLSAVRAREVLIAQMPEKPFTLNDLKVGYMIMKKVKCCFDISTVRIIGEIGGQSIVEIASESADRKFVLNHFAVKSYTRGGLKNHTLSPRFCNGCKKNKCSRCVSYVKCKTCQKKFCQNCLDIKLKSCGSCKDWFCNKCQEFNDCSECDMPNCQNCYALDDEACARCCHDSQNFGPFDPGEWDEWFDY